jgi:hypothetical protein
MCNKGENFDDVISGLEQKRKLWKKAIKQAKRAVPEVRNGQDKSEQDKTEQNNQTEEQEEVLFEYLTTLENCLMLEDAVQLMEQNQNPTPSQPSQQDTQNQ